MNVRLLAAAVVVGSVALGAAVLVGGLASSTPADDEASADDLLTREQPEGSVFEFADMAWHVRHNGFGVVTTSVADDACGRVDLRPRAASTIEATHAALALTSQPATSPARLEMRTVEQLRRPEPNAWEVAWLIWAYQDDQRFYYFTVKPNGWELGKADPAYPGSQRFLATGEEPSVEVGDWVDVVVEHADGQMAVQVDGTEVVSFVDEERPYGDGPLGMYTEDAHVQFRPEGC